MLLSVFDLGPGVVMSVHVRQIYSVRENDFCREKMKVDSMLEHFQAADRKMILS